jgi:hypothetical protein
MLILKYFVSVGAVLIAGLLALNAHLAPSGGSPVQAMTTDSLPVAKPVAPPEPDLPIVEPVSVPDKKAAKSSRSSKKSSRRSRD